MILIQSEELNQSSKKVIEIDPELEVFKKEDNTKFSKTLSTFYTGNRTTEKLDGRDYNENISESLGLKRGLTSNTTLGFNPSEDSSNSTNNNTVGGSFSGLLGRRKSPIGPSLTGNRETSKEKENTSISPKGSEKTPELVSPRRFDRSNTTVNFNTPALEEESLNAYVPSISKNSRVEIIFYNQRSRLGGVKESQVLENIPEGNSRSNSYERRQTELSFREREDDNFKTSNTKMNTKPDLDHKNQVKTLLTSKKTLSNENFVSNQEKDISTPEFSKAHSPEENTNFLSNFNRGRESPLNTQNIINPPNVINKL